MVAEFENLNRQEYHFLKKKSQWLPFTPTTTKHIYIYYYRDDFLGDYSLYIEMELPKNESLDTSQFSNWKKISNDWEEKNKYIFSQVQK